MPRPVRFVHAADLHLDAPFGGVEADDPRVRAALVESTYEALARVVDTCVQNEVDFLLLAGDVYNAKDKSLRAQIRFQAAMRRLAEAGIRAFVVHGNHDPANGWTAGLDMPESVTIFRPGRVERFEVEADGELLCALYGRSFAKSKETDDFSPGYRRAPEDPVAIGVLHSNVGGQAGYEDYAPSSIQGLREAGMDYWALGHIHKPMSLCDAPRIVYPGCTQGLNPTEDGPRGCRLVELDPSGVVSDRFVDTASFVWANRTLPIDDFKTIEGLKDGLASLSDDAREEAGKPVVLRVDLVGRGALHPILARAGTVQALVEELRAEQLDHDQWLWVDRVRDRTARVIDLDRVREQQDFVGDLVRLAEERLASPDSARALVDEVSAQILEKTGGLGLEFDADAVVRQALDVCLDRFEEVEQ